MVLRSTTDLQEIWFLPRSYVFDKVVFKNEETGVDQEFNEVSKKDGIYGYIQVAVDLEEFKFYTMKVYSGEDVVYYTKVFCTNQDIEDYSINDGVYIKANDADNEYITA